MKRSLLLVLLAVVPLAAAARPSAAAPCLIPRVASDSNPVVAPDGRFLLFRRREAVCPLRESVWRSDLTGRHFRRILKPTPLLGRVSWRKDGLISATITRRRASLLLSPAGKVRGSVAVMNPFWAPDSRRAAYVDHSQIYIWPDSTVVGGGNNFVSAPTWSPFGDRLAFARVVATTGGFHSELVVVGAGGGEEQVIFAAAPIGQPEWSPDGALLTFVADATPNLYVATPDGATVRKLTVGFRHAGDLPTWSPDSRWIAFTATRGSRYALYVIRPDGNGLHQIAPHVAAPLGELAWYPGDKDVAYQGSTSRCRRIGIFLARLDGRGSRRLTNACP